jgi:hypothetical protein
MLFYGESQFHSKLSQLLQLVNAWLVELWNDYEHNYQEKHKLQSCYDQSNLMERCP